MARSSRYFSRDAITYYALSTPAIALQVFFSSSIAANPQAITPQVSSFGSGISQVVQLLPWGILALSIVAVVRFRPSALAALLTASFFVATTALGDSGPFGSASALTGTVSLVIVASFGALIGFNYARAAKVLAGREAVIESRGPLGYQLYSTSLELFLPLVAVLALAAAVSGIVATIKVQTQLLPEPLSTLSSLYLQTRIGLVLVSLTVAGAMVWIMRQILEPIILYFTITRDDAITYALGEVADITKKVRRQIRTRPSSGRAWLGVGVVIVSSVFLLTIQAVGPENVSNNLLSLFGLHGITSTTGERTLETSAQSLLRSVDASALQGQDLIRAIIRVLWG